MWQRAVLLRAGPVGRARRNGEKADPDSRGGTRPVPLGGAGRVGEARAGRGAVLPLGGQWLVRV